MRSLSKCQRNYGVPKSLPKDERQRREGAAREWRRQNCWSPNQLRHTRATFIRERFGIEASQVVLGHADAGVTQIYAERDFAKAAEIMRQIG